MTMINPCLVSTPHQAPREATVWRWHSIGSLQRLVLALMLCCMMSVETAAGEELLHCQEANAVVHYQNQDDAMMACAAAADSLSFMESHGFVIEVDRPLVISVVEPVSWIECRCAFGWFNAVEDRIEVLPFALSKRLALDSGVFGMPLTRELYRSFFAHEIAHAVAHSNFRIPNPSVAAHEYIAYTIQLATMTPLLRSEILNRLDVGAFTCDQEISDIYLALGPEQFAVKAYQHFQRPDNGTRFFQQLLAQRLANDPD